MKTFKNFRSLEEAKKNIIEVFDMAADMIISNSSETSSAYQIATTVRRYRRFSEKQAAIFAKEFLTYSEHTIMNCLAVEVADAIAVIVDTETKTEIEESKIKMFKSGDVIKVTTNQGTYEVVVIKMFAERICVYNPCGKYACYLKNTSDGWMKEDDGMTIKEIRHRNRPDLILPLESK